MLVADAGTGRSTFDVEGFSRSVLGPTPLLSAWLIEYDRRWAAVRLASPRDGGAGASPKMKNLMKAPIKNTTESCPSTKPWVKDSLKLKQSAWRFLGGFFSSEKKGVLTRAERGHQKRHLKKATRLVSEIDHSRLQATHFASVETWQTNESMSMKCPSSPAGLSIRLRGSW